MTPIFQTSTYAQEEPGVHSGYEYSRTQNPTRTALQDNLASLEGADHGMVFASGMAATDALMHLLSPGDQVIACNDLYGGSYRIFTRVYQPWGIDFDFTSMDPEVDWSNLLSDKTKMIWIETPTNPLLNVIDIKAVVEKVKAYRKDIIVVVDNTFATPYLQQPLHLGADVVVHSITKYISGHSDVVMGAICTSDPVLAEELAFIQNSCGAVSGPQDCFLVLRGIKTLHVRMQRHCENAAKVAEYLVQHPKVEEVYYPGLNTHRNHAVAAAQMTDFGGMVSFSLKSDDVEKAKSLLSSFRVFILAESLGGVESLCGHPASMTHASIPKAERMKAGLNDSLIRLSVGIEDIKDLIEDIEQALTTV
jgi:cystathionine beta-lyase